MQSETVFIFRRRRAGAASLYGRFLWIGFCRHFQGANTNAVSKIQSENKSQLCLGNAGLATSCQFFVIAAVYLALFGWESFSLRQFQPLKTLSFSFSHLAELKNNEYMSNMNNLFQKTYEIQNTEKNVRKIAHFLPIQCPTAFFSPINQNTNSNQSLKRLLHHNLETLHDHLAKSWTKKNLIEWKEKMS